MFSLKHSSWKNYFPLMCYYQYNISQMCHCQAYLPHTNLQLCCIMINPAKAGKQNVLKEKRLFSKYRHIHFSYM